MGIYAEIAKGELHPDKLYASNQNCILLNTLGKTTEDREKITSQLVTKLDGDMNPIPTCECGFIEDPLSLGIGTLTCPRCKTSVTSALAKPIRPTIFFRAPPGIHGLLQPVFLTHFLAAFYRANFNMYLYLTDTSYRGTDSDVEALGIPRGYNYFIDNLEEIMCRLATILPYRKKPAVHDLITLYRLNKEVIHTQHLYLLNKTMNVIEVNDLSTWMNTQFIKMSDIAFAMLGIDESKGRLAVISNRIARTQHTLATFYLEYFKEVIGQKHGALRTQMFNARGTVTQRCVATSITTNLKHPSEIHLAYTPTLHMLYPQVMGKLFKMGYTHQQASEYINAYTHTFSPMLHQFLLDILDIDETRDKVTEFIMQRFPTLGQGSMPLVGVTWVKKDVRDKTVSTSILGVRSLNLDYDGDELSLGVRPPYAEFDRLRMQYNMIATDKLREINSNLVLSDPITTNIMNWYDHESTLTKDLTKEQKVIEMFGI